MYLWAASTRVSQMLALWNICGAVSPSISNRKHEVRPQSMSRWLSRGDSQIRVMCRSYNKNKFKSKMPQVQMCNDTLFGMYFDVWANNTQQLSRISSEGIIIIISPHVRSDA